MRWNLTDGFSSPTSNVGAPPLIAGMSNRQVACAACLKQFQKAMLKEWKTMLKAWKAMPKRFATRMTA